MPTYFRQKVMAAGIAALQGITDAFVALSRALDYNERNSRNHPIPSRLLGINNRKIVSRSTVLNEWEGKQKLQLHGLKIPKNMVITPKDKFVLLEEMRAPFVMKGLSSEVVHKTDIGGVSLNLKTEEEIQIRLEEMYERLKDKMGAD